MAPEQNKRKRPVLTSSQRSKKRQKVERVGSTASKDVQRLEVALDALPWDEVQMPDIFEDAEGFYGLEEVEDVQVVRDGNRVQFLSAKTRTDHVAEEFEGFGDDEEIVIGKQTHIESATKAVKAKKDQKKSKKKSGTSVKDVGTLENYKGNVFAMLKEDNMADEVDISAWKELDLSTKLLSTLAKLGFSSPTPIQKESIPEILAGHDVIGKASTGSGKTLAFGIPVLEKWLEDYRCQDVSSVDKLKAPIALVLSPTRELAHQLTEHLAALCAGLSDAPYIATVTGGLSVQKQQRQLQKADIIIGTPGRLWEVMISSVELLVAVKKIQFLIIDEADRLLTEGHFNEVKDILNAIDHLVNADGGEILVPKRQTLIFSATFHKGLQQKLAGRGKYSSMNNNDAIEYLMKELNFREEKPKFIDVNPTSQMADGLREGMVECAGIEKDLYLYALLLYHPSQRILIFTNSIHSVRRLTPLLQNLNLSAHALHSQMPQKARLRSVERFSSSSISILVATDIAARGLDIPAVNLVIHYHLPRAASTYIHRSGRTARASASGLSILLCAPEEVIPTRRLVAKVHAQNATTAGAFQKSKHYLRSINLDRRIVARLGPRVTLAKRIADSMLAKEKKRQEGDWLRTAASELGVDYDSEEFEKAGGIGKSVRGKERKAKEREAQGLSKAEVAAMKVELKVLLKQRINVGVSERYLTAGGKGVVDVDELLSGVKGDFLGKVDGVDL